MGASSESAERWGLTDAIVGLVVSIVLAGLVGAAVITARGDYTGKWSEHGAAAGRIAAQIATDGTLTTLPPSPQLDRIMSTAQASESASNPRGKSFAKSTRGHGSMSTTACVR